MFWVYILENSVDRFYIGHTDNLDRRLGGHNRTDKICGKFSRKNGPWNLVPVGRAFQPLECSASSA